VQAVIIESKGEEEREPREKIKVGEKGRRHFRSTCGNRTNDILYLS